MSSSRRMFAYWLKRSLTNIIIVRVPNCQMECDATTKKKQASVEDEAANYVTRVYFSIFFHCEKNKVMLLMEFLLLVSFSLKNILQLILTSKKKRLFDCGRKRRKWKKGAREWSWKKWKRRRRLIGRECDSKCHSRGGCLLSCFLKDFSSFIKCKKGNFFLYLKNPKKFKWILFLY